MEGEIVFKIIFKMRRIVNKLSNYYEQKIQLYEGTEITITTRQHSILLAIKNNIGCNQKYLSKVMGIDNTTLSRSLITLMDNRLVENIGSIRDAKLMLTERGKKCLKQSRLGIEKLEKKLEEEIGNDNLKKLAEELIRIEEYLKKE